MTKLSRFAALGLAGVMSLGLFSMAGCGNNAADSGSADKEKSGSNSKGGTTITMMYSGTAAENDFETEVLPGLVKEAFPDINLEVTKLPDEQYYTSLKTKLASGECPDIILVQPMYAGANSVFGLAEAGYLEPLTDMKAVELSGVGKSSFTYNGEVYGIPSGVTMLGTYYNEDMFKEHNLEVPQTWDEFLNVCKTLKDAGITPIVMGDKDLWMMQFGLYQIACNEVYANNADFDKQLRTGETKFTDKDTWDKVLTMYTQLYDNGYIDSNSLGLASPQAQQKFIDGQAAMIFDGSFDYAAVVEAKGAVDFTRGYFPLPGSNGETYAAMAPGAGPAIYSGSKHKEECKAILEMLYDGESDMYKAYVDSGRIIPTYGYGYDDVNPIYKRFMDLYAEGKAFYWCNQAWPAGTEDEMEAKLSEYIGKQGTTVADITKAMQDKFDELLAASNE